MDADEKRLFITDLTSNIARELIAKVDQMPGNWDGHELRELIAEKFDHERSSLMKRERSSNRKRFREYYRTAREIW